MSFESRLLYNLDPNSVSARLSHIAQRSISLTEVGSCVLCSRSRSVGASEEEEEVEEAPDEEPRHDEDEQREYEQEERAHRLLLRPACNTRASRSMRTHCGRFCWFSGGGGGGWVVAGRGGGVSTEQPAPHNAPPRHTGRIVTYVVTETCHPDPVGEERPALPLTPGKVRLNSPCVHFRPDWVPCQDANCFIFAMKTFF